MSNVCVNRRRWLKGTAAALAAPRLQGLAWAAPGAADARCLLVFLRGGYDALSAVVPPGSFYREVRPTTAIGRAVPLDGGWGLHPALQGSVLPLVRKGQALFVPFAGHPAALRSHFEMQDRIERGEAGHGTREGGTGFLNRLAQRLGARAGLPIAFSERLPLALRGPADAANVSLSARTAPGDAGRQRALASLYRDSPLGERVQQGFAVREDVQRERMNTAGAALSPADRFEGEARHMARLMRERHPLGFLDVGGWDTHVNQGADEGLLAQRLGALGRGLAAYADELGTANWARTTVVVISEFGRTLRENGSRGTDHGHGSIAWVLGGSLATQSGASVLRGEQQSIEPRTLHEDRDLPVLNDLRGVLAGLWARQYALGADELAFVFPQARPLELGLL